MLIQKKSFSVSSSEISSPIFFRDNYLSGIVYFFWVYSLMLLFEEPWMMTRYRPFAELLKDR